MCPRPSLTSPAEVAGCLSLPLKHCLPEGLRAHLELEPALVRPERREIARSEALREGKEREEEEGFLAPGTVLAGRAI